MRKIAVIFLLFGMSMVCNAQAAEPPESFTGLQINIVNPSGRLAVPPGFWTVRDFMAAFGPGEWKNTGETWTYTVKQDNHILSFDFLKDKNEALGQFAVLKGITENGASLPSEEVWQKFQLGFMHSAKGKIAAAMHVIRSLIPALELYNIDVGRYPTTEQGLEALVQKPSKEPIPATYSGPYVDGGIPKDPWDRPYQYRCPGEHGSFDLFSYGASGNPGGTGKDQEIKSWDLEFTNW